MCCDMSMMLDQGSRDVPGRGPSVPLTLLVSGCRCFPHSNPGGRSPPGRTWERGLCPDQAIPGPRMESPRPIPGGPVLFSIAWPASPGTHPYPLSQRREEGEGGPPRISGALTNRREGGPDEPEQVLSGRVWQAPWTFVMAVSQGRSLSPF